MSALPSDLESTLTLCSPSLSLISSHQILDTEIAIKGKTKDTLG